MSRTLILCVLGLSMASALSGEAPRKPAGGAKEAAPGRTVIPFTVDATGEPKPALRYRLLPELSEMNPGNPILGYTVCFGEQHTFYRQKSAIEQREKWQTMPLAELPVREVLRAYGGWSLRQADYAARLTTPDWQLLPKMRAEGINFLLPDLQQLRELAGALKVRFRGEVAAGKFDAAVNTAKTMLALSRHLAEHPTLIGNLVGTAVALVALGPVEEMIGRPGCPNLYWALTDLPGPFIDLRKGMEAERLMLARDFALFKVDTPLSAARLEKVLVRIDDIMDGITFMGDKSKGASAELRKRAGDAAGVAAARKRLAATGLDAGDVNGLPALQAVLLDEQRAYEELRDERLKWTQVPWPRAYGELKKGAQSRAVFARLVPSIYKVLLNRTRVDQRLAMLRHVEAIRLYAAAHAGKLPARLADIAVPLPVDPITGKAFDYKVEGKKAILSGTPPRGLEKVPTFNVRYEITIR